MDNNNGNVGHWASIVSYRECQRNYPTRRGRGRHAVDGCLEFLPVEDDRNPEALLCAACGCHRNFHRREEVPIRVEPGMAQILQQLAAAPPPPHLPILAPHNPVPVPAPAPAPAPAAVNANQEENLGDGEVEEEPEPRRRGRTRLKQGQKEAMRRYAERLEWSLQGHNEEELFRFCSEIGIIPEVFKVWMKNNRRKYVDGRETSSSADGF